MFTKGKMIITNPNTNAKVVFAVYQASLVDGYVDWLLTLSVSISTQSTTIIKLSFIVAIKYCQNIEFHILALKLNAHVYLVNFFITK
jgi:hypothetical protein